MPDQPASERTEQATPERLRKAREEGRVAQSREMCSALMISALLLVLGVSAGGLYRFLAAQMRRGLSLEMAGPANAALANGLLQSEVVGFIKAICPFLLAGLGVSVLGSLLVGGWAFSPKAAQLRGSRISPVSGLKNLLSARSAVNLLTSLAKLTVILAVVYLYMRDKMPFCLALRYAAAGGIVTGMAQLVFGLALRIAAALLIIGAADMLWQKWKHKRDLRMTRQEVKEEMRQHEMSPELRGRVRRIQLEMAQKRLIQDVPTADVVIANPTHVAVALKYDPQVMDAPIVVAKGADLLCEKIKEIAGEHNIPVVHRPELARTLYQSVDVDEAIPESLFVAVAEVLAMIYRLRQRRLGKAGERNRL
ncbi:MAG: flagellar biosynthesis protein FlhB [Planctomycetota bacterium]|jgi:flagellar biosynthetic protein FlhB